LNSSSQPSDDKKFLNRTLEAALHIGLIALLLFWCFRIIQPFIHIMLWGIIITVALHPVYNSLRSALGGRKRLSAALITLVTLLLLIVPIFLLAGSLIDTVRELSMMLRKGTLDIPPPPESIKSWLIIGEPLYKFWSLASDNLGTALGKMAPQLKAVGSWLLSSAASVGFGILQFIIAIIISGILLAYAEGGQKAVRSIANRLASERGDEFADLAGATVRSVAQGILGVALIQSLLAGIGFLVVGVPAAGLWAMILFLIAVVQLPSFIVIGPVIVYVFYTASTTVAILFTIWGVLIGLSDNLLRPILLGRGVDVPMLVIFIGATGGLIYRGIIGLFVGAIIFALGYKLILAWMNRDTEPEEEPAKT